MASPAQPSTPASTDNNEARRSGEAAGATQLSKCVSCQYYDRKNVRAGEARGVQWGLCRRDAPSLNPVNPKMHAIEGIWPTVRDDDWCGRWHAQVRQSAEPATTSSGATVTAMPPTIGSVPRSLPVNGGAAALAAKAPLPKRPSEPPRT
jgi:hypothetical protein